MEHHHKEEYIIGALAIVVFAFMVLNFSHIYPERPKPPQAPIVDHCQVEPTPTTTKVIVSKPQVSTFNPRDGVSENPTHEVYIPSNFLGTHLRPSEIFVNPEEHIVPKR